MDIAEFIERSNAAKGTAELFSFMETAATSFGFEYVAYGALTNHVIYNAERYESPAVILNYPDQWVSRYFEQSYQAIDPIVLMTPAMHGPFTWDRLCRTTTLTEGQRTFFAESLSAGLHSGLSVPLHGPFGNTSVVSFACRHENPDADMRQAFLQAISAQFHTVYTDLVLGIRQVRPTVHLTERERECLLWSARGKTSWDTGEILGVSEHTVNFHLKNALAKLEAASRVVAVVKAIRAGLINP
jgi:DNA-binding CsgD family transcriptional regulator